MRCKPEVDTGDFVGTRDGFSGSIVRLVGPRTGRILPELGNPTSLFPLYLWGCAILPHTLGVLPRTLTQDRPYAVPIVQEQGWQQEQSP